MRSSPVVAADETGWRERGSQRLFVWTFNTPTERYFVRRGRGKQVVDEVLGDGFGGVLVSDFYAAYNHYPGLKQRCWVHLLRDIREPEGPLSQGCASVSVGERSQRALHEGAGVSSHTMHASTAEAECGPTAAGAPIAGIVPAYATDPSAVQGKLCRRIEQFIKELFVFVAEPRAPSDNNTLQSEAFGTWWSAGRSAAPNRHALCAGTESKMALASLFGTCAPNIATPSSPAASFSSPPNSEQLPGSSCR